MQKIFSIEPNRLLPAEPGDRLVDAAEAACAEAPISATALLPRKRSVPRRRRKASPHGVAADLSRRISRHQKIDQRRLMSAATCKSAPADQGRPKPEW